MQYLLISHFLLLILNSISALNVRPGSLTGNRKTAGQETHNYNNFERITQLYRNTSVQTNSQLAFKPMPGSFKNDQVSWSHKKWKRLTHLDQVSSKDRDTHMECYHFNYHVVIASITDLMLHWRWKNVTMFVDSLSDSEQKQLKIYVQKKFSGNVDIFHRHSTAQFVNILQQRSHISQYVVICCQETVNELLKSVIAESLLGNHSQWIIAFDGILNALKNINISTAMQITTALRKHRGHKNEIIRNGVDFHDIFFSSNIQQTVAVHFASWDTDTKLRFLEDFDKDENRHPTLLGRNIRTVGMTVMPFIRTWSLSNGTVLFSGYNRDVFKIIVFDFFKANEIALKQEDGLAGSLINGTYTGIVGTLYRKDADLTALPLGETSERMKVISYVVFIRSIGVGLGYQLPEAAISADAYILPFSPITWLYIASAFVAILACLFVTEFSGFTNGMDRIRISSRTFRLITGAIFEEVLQYPTTPAKKIIYATLLLATAVTFTVYSSVLTSFLASQQMALPIRELEDVPLMKDYKPVMIQGSNWEGIFRNSKDGVLASVWKRVERCGSDCLAASYEVASNKVFMDKYVYIAEKSIVKNYLDDPCRCKVIPTTYGRSHMFFAARPDFPFNRITYKMMLRLHEAGIIRRFSIKYKLDSYSDCERELKGVSMDLNQVQGLFYILLGGIMLSFAVLGIEKAVYRRH